MKAFKLLKILMLAFLLFENAYSARLDDEDRKEVRTMLDELITESKDKDGNIKMDIFNMVSFQSLEEFHADRKLTREELLKFKAELERVAAKVPAKEQEVKIRELFDKNLLVVDNTKKEKVKEGQICNHWDCEDGLSCAPAPARAEVAGKLKASGQECKSDGECTSGECITGNDKKLRCEEVYRCYRPQAEGVSCLENPVCSKGSCEEIYFLDGNISACVKNGVECKENLDCCSDSCNKGKCVENYRCQDCVKSGKLSRGQKCCADESYEKGGSCVPIVIPLNPFVKIFNTFIDGIFPSAMAQTNLSDTDIKYRNRAKNSGFYTGAGTGDKTPVENSNEQIGLISVAIGEPSNFETCEINLVTDYAKRLTESRMPGNEAVSMLDVELSLLGFEYVAGGENQIVDYWRGGSEKKSIHERMTKIAKKRSKLREAFYSDLRWFEPKIKCLCLEKNGWKQMNDEQRSYYEESCRLGLAIPPLPNGSGDTLQKYRSERDQKTIEMAMSPDQWSAKIAEFKNSVENQEVDEGDDASGIKALELLETWASTNATIEEINLIITNSSMSDLYEVYEWMKTEAAWNKEDRTKHRKNKLYDWEVANHATASDPMAAAALLAAGVVALLGGFAFASTVSAWVAVAVITSAAASAGAGLWMISSLRGAWYSKAPYVEDVANGHYKCGKRTQCYKFQRYVHQPYNNVCDKNISANACIKHFLVDEKGNGDQSLLVDPWIPQGFKKDDLIRDTRDLSNLLDQGASRALNTMKGGLPLPTNFFVGFFRRPKATVEQWVQSGNRPRYTRDFFSRTVINNRVLADYAPKLKSSAKKTYVINEKLKEKIIDGAADFVMGLGWIKEKEDARRFGRYVYKYHFVWPKAAYGDILIYPQPGLISYTGLIANGLANNMDFSASVAGGFRQLQQSYSQASSRRRDMFAQSGNRIGIDNNSNSNPSHASGSGSNGSVGFGQGGSFSGFGSMGNSGFASLSSGNTASLDATGFSSGAQQAVANLKKVREAQKNEADEFRKNMGGTPRGQRLLAAASNFKNDFYSDATKGSSSIFGGGVGSGGSLLSGGDTNLNSNNQNSGAANTATGAGANNKRSSLFSDSLSGSGSGSGSDSSGAFGGGGYGYGGDSSQQDSGSRGGTNMSPEDARRLSDAIKNRDGDNAKYERQDGMSLWEIVTNTYIRVYDRLLERKDTSLD